MPNLPTLTVTQAQMDRLLQTFGDVNGYKSWLRQQVKAAVFDHESLAIQNQAKADIEVRRTEINADLDTAT
jgi:hypothetical protein